MRKDLLALTARPSPLDRALRQLLRCATTTVALLAHRRIRQPTTNLGRRIAFADGTAAAVYRETVIDAAPLDDPTVLVVTFRLRRARAPWVHALFRFESELNTVFFAGFPGLVSKLWLRHDEVGRYRGVYQWSGADLALSYARALWWVLAIVSEPDSIAYKVLPGLRRDDVLADPSLVAGQPGADDWWRPV